MRDLELFWHNMDVPVLIQIAISHYQFETIHPFCDGNGRIGRLLIVLQLMERQLLVRPTLYLSDFFEQHRASYYDALMATRISHDLGHWVRFFLQGVVSTAQNGKETFLQILQLQQNIQQQILSLGRRAESAQLLMNAFYQRPVMSAAEAISYLSLSQPTAQKLLKELCDMHILQEISGRSRYRVFAFQAYLQIFMS
jgi:Fic family protein